MRHPEPTPKFKGVWIPRDLWYHPSLSTTEKHLLAEIHSLSEDGGEACYASDAYLARFLNVSEGHVANRLSSLHRRGFIKCWSIPDSSRSNGKRRYLELQPRKEWPQEPKQSVKRGRDNPCVATKQGTSSFDEPPPCVATKQGTSSFDEPPSSSFDEVLVPDIHDNKADGGTSGGDSPAPAHASRARENAAAAPPPVGDLLPETDFDLEAFSILDEVIQDPPRSRLLCAGRSPATVRRYVERARERARDPNACGGMLIRALEGAWWDREPAVASKPTLKERYDALNRQLETMHVRTADELFSIPARG